ncbi:molybdenum cofactor biosynthesis protein B [Acinetobacter junii SH205]|jgi:molybdenum cofactor biosynthesis protein B|uniref:Molybdenum cofactor biosynthesis protein B n=2 Tax=Acinetobacter TaxID=469 RepID=A0AA42SPG2_ACIJO|nr:MULTISPECIES: molybdenum cofactor biosynthesis protein B [Acinetobacter]EEY91672.1 molybdenum cofactor biosynthesis protein B [Acinetobacter junii SH205]MBC6677786.1 molybdenum cofactor biosynthesis protein B [Acinetobacter sp.]MDH0969483.1 molybdenum cofactor biosynthesis protein B [Acinetobacter johnsonii]MDH1700067.1 molybdenum cofactor biosynthesis protein B [Acinetobacter johnsonii]HRB83050.1 molybdenum cofactor biosynthesis protein B [Acinetobacter johnsonii]
MSKPAAQFIPINIAVLTVSDSRTLAEDTSGQYLADQVVAAGHQLADRQLITDDIYRIRAVISGWIADPNIHAIITTGGTGFYIRDSMPEAVSVLFDKSIDGFGEMFRLISKDEIGMSTIQSRAVAGMANGTGIFCLPGSSGACRTGWEGILKDQFDNRTRPCNFIPHFMRTNPTHD